MFARLFKRRTKPVRVELTDEERQAMQSRQASRGAARADGSAGQTSPTSWGPHSGSFGS